jgi:hypothetical protein
MNTMRHVAAPLNENKGYKMMHLLNHNVFGPGQLWNMTPGPSKSNGDMERDIETSLKRAVLDKGLIIGFEAKVTYKNDPMIETQAELNRNPDRYRFSKITFSAWQYELNAMGTAYDQRSAKRDVEVTDIDGGVVNWNYGGLTLLRDKPRILDPNTIVQDLIDAGISNAAAQKIWQYNQDIKAGTIPAPAKTASTTRKVRSRRRSRTPTKDKRIMETKWKASDVSWV